MLHAPFDMVLEASIEGLWDSIVDDSRPRKAKDPLDTPRPTNASSDPASEKLFRKFVEKNPVFRDPVYQRNLQRLIERNREFEDARK
jgi:hypothetical protein